MIVFELDSATGIAIVDCGIPWNVSAFEYMSYVDEPLDVGCVIMSWCPLHRQPRRRCREMWHFGIDRHGNMVPR